MSKLYLGHLTTEQLRDIINDYKKCGICDNCKAYSTEGWKCGYVAKIALKELTRRGEALGHLTTEQLQDIINDYKKCGNCNNCKAHSPEGWRCTYMAETASKELTRRGEA